MTGTAMPDVAWYGPGRSATAPVPRKGRYDIYGQSRALPEAVLAEDVEMSSPARATRTRDHVVARLRILGRYSAGWDGERGAAPRPSAINDAINFVANLGIDPAFSAALESDGAVELVLSGAGLRLVLVFEGDGKVHLHMRHPGQVMSHTELDIPTFIGNGVQIEQTLQSFDRAA